MQPGLGQKCKHSGLLYGLTWHAGVERGPGEKRRRHVKPSPLLFSLESRSSPSRFPIVPTNRPTKSNSNFSNESGFIWHQTKVRSIKKSFGKSVRKSAHDPLAISGQELSVIFSFLPLITGKIASFTVKQSFLSIYIVCERWRSKDVAYARTTESGCNRSV